MSQNARHHGAQSAPDKSLLLVHLKYILGYEPNSIDLQFPTPRLEAAVQLAACEARLDQAHAHYVRSQAVHRDEKFDNIMECMEDLLYFAKLDGKDIQATLSRLMKLESLSTFVSNRRKRLANRYLREAHNQRKRALQVYINYVFTETEQ